MLINGIHVGDRYNRPTANNSLALRALFYNNGELVDPVEILGVAIFPKSANEYPNTIYNDVGMISNDKVPVLNILVYDNDPIGLYTVIRPTDDAINGFQQVDFHTSCNAGIYKLSKGDFVATIPVNKYGLNVSGAGLNYYNYLYSVSTLEALNSLIGVTNPSMVSFSSTSSVLNNPRSYIDIWTVKMFEGSQYQTFVNEFTIYNDSVVMMGEPPIINLTSKLVNKHVQLGEKINLTISNEMAIGNKAINDSIKNVIKESAIVNPAIEIRKMNEVPSVGGSYLVSSYNNTSATTYTTGDDSVVFSWDTTTLPAIQAANTTSFDNVRGTYMIRMKCDVLNETKITPPFYINLS